MSSDAIGQSNWPVAGARGELQRKRDVRLMKGIYLSFPKRNLSFSHLFPYNQSFLSGKTQQPKKANKRTLTDFCQKHHAWARSQNLKVTKRMRSDARPSLLKVKLSKRHMNHVLCDLKTISSENNRESFVIFCWVPPKAPGQSPGLAFFDSVFS